jgi:aryl-alcohol dehydrogenase-like predicted oxidoreductase
MDLSSKLSTQSLRDRYFNLTCLKSFGAGGGGNFTNEELIGKAIKLHGREKFVIATKFGIGFDANKTQIVSGKEDFIRSQLADSLSRLDTNYIDLYYMHRMDPDTPIEETMTVLKSLVEEGKIRYIGLSECTPSELRRAHAVHPVTAIQMEWSLQTRDIEELVVPTARELGVAIVAYSPLGRGFLADIAAFDSLSETDWRKSNPRFSGENYGENKKRAANFFEIAKRKGCTPAQLALAWVHSQGEDVFPIPGTKSSGRIEENANSFTVLPLSAEERKEIEDSVSVVGDRYPATMATRSFNARL